MRATLKRVAGFCLSENINLVFFPALPRAADASLSLPPPDNLGMCTFTSAHSQASLWVSWLIVTTCSFLLFRKKHFHLKFLACPASHTSRGRFVSRVRFCASVLQTLLHVKVCCWCVRLNRGGGSFSCLSNDPSTGAARSALVVGLHVNVHQDKIPFAQTPKEDI